MSAHVQVEISCNVCRKVIKGKRYKCLRCFDYDMCSSCYELGDKPKPDDEPHDSTHPIQCVIPKEEFALYYGGEEVGDESILSFTCPLCAQTGFTKQTLKRHVVKHKGAKHPLHSLICPVCLLNPTEDGIVTHDFVTHINNDHNISNDDSDVSEDEEPEPAPTNSQVNRIERVLRMHRNNPDSRTDQEPVAAPTNLQVNRVERALRMHTNISDYTEQELFTYWQNQYLGDESRESSTSQPPRGSSRLRVLSDDPTMTMYSDVFNTRSSRPNTTSGRNSSSTTAVYSDEPTTRRLERNSTIVRNSPSTLTVHHEPTTRAPRQYASFGRNYSPSTITVYSDEPTTGTQRIYSTARQNSPPTITLHSSNLEYLTAAITNRTESTTSRQNSAPITAVYLNNMDIPTAAVSPRRERNPRRPATTPSNTIDLDYELAVQMQQSENDRVRLPRQRAIGNRLGRAAREMNANLERLQDDENRREVDERDRARREIVANLERLQDGNRREISGRNHTRLGGIGFVRQRSDDNPGPLTRAEAEIIRELLHEDGNRHEVGGVNRNRREVETRQRAAGDRTSQIIAQLLRIQDESRLDSGPLTRAEVELIREQLNEDGNRREVSGRNRTRLGGVGFARQRSDGNPGPLTRGEAEIIRELLHEDGNRREVGSVNHNRREVETRQRAVSDRASEIIAQLRRAQEDETRLEADNPVTLNLRMAALARLQEETRKKLNRIGVDNTGKDAKEPKTEPKAPETTDPPEKPKPTPKLILKKVFKKLAAKEEAKSEKGRDEFITQLLLSTLVERESALVEEVIKVEEENLEKEKSKAEKEAKKKSDEE